MNALRVIASGVRIGEPAAAVVQRVVGSGTLGQLWASCCLMAAEQAGEVFWEAGGTVGRCLVVCMATSLGLKSVLCQGQWRARLLCTLGYHHLMVLPLECQENEHCATLARPGKAIAYCNEQELARLMPLAWNSSTYVLARSWSWRAHALTRLKATLALGRSPCARMTSSSLQGGEAAARGITTEACSQPMAELQHRNDDAGAQQHTVWSAALTCQQC